MPYRGQPKISPAMSPDTSSTVVLWDRDNVAPVPEFDGATAYRWNGYEESGEVRSLLRYCDIHSERLREKYCAWVHDLGHAAVGAGTLADALRRHDGFSLWWMSLLVEKSVWKSPAIKDAIRVLAFEEIVRDMKPARLILMTANRALEKTLAGFCRRLEIKFVSKRLHGDQAQTRSLGALLRRLPHPLLGLQSLVRRAWRGKALAEATIPQWFGGGDATFFCSYFSNLDLAAAQRASFNSHYWSGLPDLLSRMGRRGNWLHMFTPGGAVHDPCVARTLASGFNQHAAQQGMHGFVDAGMDRKLLLRVFRGWVQINFASWRLGRIREAFTPSGSALSLWPLLKRDWAASIRGSAAVDSLVWVELFDKALGQMPFQGQGFYLCENQAWERALIHAWRKHGHGHLVAVPHSTRSAWDLRFFRDARVAADPTRRAFGPLPDQVAVNGEAAWKVFCGEHYTEAELAPCEALRYNYLSTLPQKSPCEVHAQGPLRVLILGDYVVQMTRDMLAALTAALPYLSPDARFTLKAHPYSPVDTADYPALPIHLMTERLGANMLEFDVAFSSNLTSAAVDAYLAGLPVVVALNWNDLNFSPLRGQADATFVSAPQELAQALLASATHAGHPRQFFFLDPKLPRWSRLLDRHGMAKMPSAESQKHVQD
jgi:surface carbohydrate biosynthesis protein (TIGR04326 family)